MAVAAPHPDDWELPAVQEIVKFVAANRRAIADLVATISSQQRYYAEALEQLRWAGQFAADVAAPVSALAEHARDTIDCVNSVLGQTASWQQHNRLMLETVRFLQQEPTWSMGFSARTLNRASELLEQVDREGAAETTVPDVPEAVVEEAASAVEPVISEIDWSVPRPVALSFVSTVVFLVVVQWAIEHPDAAEVIGAAVGLAALCAGFATQVTGRLWSPPRGEGPPEM
jgi:hypothetical protein